MYATFAARAPGIRNMAGEPLANGRSLALPGSKDCNRGSATPSDVRGNRRIIVGRPRSWQGSPPGPLGDGSNRSVQSRLRTSRRTLLCRSLGQERTCRAGYEVVKVKRHSLLRAKIVEDRLNDQTLLFG